MSMQSMHNTGLIFAQGGVLLTSSQCNPQYKINIVNNELFDVRRGNSYHIT